jgi:hypothetical protein
MNDNKAVQVANQIRSGGNDGLLRLSTNVVLKPVRVPNMIFPEVMRRYARPRPPRVMIADLGREEENPNDPTYLAQLEAYNSELGMAMVDTMIVMGTELVSAPKDFPKPAEARWADKLKAAGFTITSEPIQRYLMWVKYIAAPSDEDIQLIMEGVGRLSGVSEKDVSEAIDTFRDNA